MQVELQSRRGRRDAEPTDKGFRLEANADWLVLGAREHLSEVRHALPDRVADEFGDGCIRLRFGNAVGLFDVPHLGLLDVYSGKWDESHFELMLAELSDISSALPFAGYESATMPYDRSLAAREDVLYHAFVYLRHVLSERTPFSERLLPALAAILREPHRKLERRSRTVELWRARRFGPRTFRRIAEGRETLVETSATRIAFRLPRNLVPGTTQENVARHTFDTAENRFVKAFIAQAIGIIDTVESTLVGERSLNERVRRQCSALRSKLTPCQSAALWTDVGDMIHMPAGSTVLQKRRGYREVFRHSRKLRSSAHIPLEPQHALDLLEIKDISDLYELWCYFQVVAALQEVIGEPPTTEVALHVSATQVTLPWGHRATWSSGVVAYYNLSFSRSKARALRSYSVPLRPDIAVWVPGESAGRYHLFDAKFKMRKPATVFSETDDDPDTHRGAGFKRDDLYKMHTYRDAIPLAQTVMILYPGEETRFFASPRGGGVGALPLKPGSATDRSRLVNELVNLLSDGS